MSTRALALRDIGRTIGVVRQRHPISGQESIFQPTNRVRATIRAKDSAGQKRDLSDIRRRREEVIAELDAKHGIGQRLRDMDERTVKYARPQPGQKYWGLTIFRCTYGDDEAWAQLLELIKEDVRESTEYYGAPDLMQSFSLKVFHDPDVFERAGKAVLRDKFLPWRSGPAMEQESDGGPILIEDNLGEIYGRGPRYSYFVQIDAESLYSIIDRETKTPLEWASLRGHVNLIDAQWKLPDPAYCAAVREIDPEVEDPFDEDEEPLEGCKLFDVGWMKTHYSVFDVGAQQYLDGEGWRINYVRPPGIVQNFDGHR